MSLYVTNIEQEMYILILLVFSHFVHSHLFNIYHLKCKEPNMDSVVSSPTSCEGIPQPVLVFCFDEVHFTLFICECG